MEFRTLIWGTLARCCSSEACAKLAVECGLVPSLGSWSSIRFCGLAVGLQVFAGEFRCRATR